MKISRSLALAVLFSSVAAVAQSEQRPPASGIDGYSHGDLTCLQGNDGTGLRLRLQRTQVREGLGSYPSLQIDIRELPLSANQKISITGSNSAGNCGASSHTCEPYASGEIQFTHFEDLSGSGLLTDGWYELRRQTGLPDTGRFKVELVEPCG